MESLLIGTVSVLYLGAAGAHIYHGRPEMALVFIGYVLANVGLVWAGRS